MEDFTALGQGEALPDLLGIEGQWIVRNYLFLYRSDDHANQDGAAPRFTKMHPREDGGFAFGLDARQLAFILGVDVDAIFHANADHSLIPVRQADVPSKHGSIGPARRFVFKLGERTGAVLVERNHQEGNA